MWRVETIVYQCDATDSCGCSKNDAVLTRIIGGETAVSESWGWIVSLRFFSTHICGGSIINPNYVLTAAHCIKAITNFKYAEVVAGIDTISQRNGQVRKINKYWVHPNYNRITYENDIAIIKLSKPLKLKDKISKVCLPTANYSTLQEYPVPGSNLVAIGWGAKSTTFSDSSDTLQQVTVQAVSKLASTCTITIKNPALQFCAGVNQGGKDTCQGDS
ncbi:unnamed protein product [Didymodactylos carnosus]|uniref:Peptidase S1 domain-containing protein n=1 Tax=Didymodactylos carnosus TaxID=1234261 RepID=A0A815WHH8_9BILA|nr:unnamed protein product [Didymodactylos carnosus]CAF1543306.1 unnamed protein product [Didymodactylos carnosus]CAF3612359.1 unnamed protein product [Didymodactylos carnosus]CAF4403787.1 unnamed protein product [Didymodactylos carnosus]